ncbi:cysteine desulfurase CsdA [Thorsellia kenyensis]|uniref:cysteine desulfurase n=1 Tax=Thorsellia kenyensis TaxID=1549888 RepID=A0ABV6C9S4_9GAMM
MLSSLENQLQKFRNSFPALSGNLIYFDSAATSLKPQVLIDTTVNFYSTAGTVHRSQYKEAQSLTDLYEETRTLIARFISAQQPENIIWTKGATESANLIAHSYFKDILTADDEIIVSESEHHANLIPWIMLAKTTGATLITLPLNENAIPCLDSFKKLINTKTKLLAITQMSNLTGAITPLQTFIEVAHRYDCKVVIDGSQGIVHSSIDVEALNIDFYFFSAHKLYGPTGVGVLYASPSVIDDMQPWQGGGKMLVHAKMEDYIAAEPPYCFEAGTPNIAGIIGFNAVLKWWQQWPLDGFEKHAISLATKTHHLLSELPLYKRISVPSSSILTFTLKGIHPSDLDMLLAEQNIAIRSGMHCAHPLNRTLGINGSIRASFAPFNTDKEVELFISAIKKAVSILR